MKVKVIVADPAGNVTIFVRTRFERKDYAAVANRLLEMELPGPGGVMMKGEQVAFILDCPSCGRARGKMEMCGLEFCGNASRSFALLTAKDLGLKGKNKVSVDVSGVNEILDVEIDADTDYTKIKMPNPLAIFDEEIFGAPARVVDFGGIMHVIVRNVEGTRETFDRYKEYINGKYDPPAMGVMFWDEKDERLTPVVYVKDVDTTYFEGSCGSGSTACCAAFGVGRGDGEHHFSITQPAGTIEASCVVENGEIRSIFIEGPVGLGEETEVEI